MKAATASSTYSDRGNSAAGYSGGLRAASEWEEIDYPYQSFLKGKLQP